jgi:hypothetical protein
MVGGVCASVFWKHTHCLQFPLQFLCTIPAVASDSSRSLVAHHPLPSRPSLQDCILALTAIQESPALRWEALGRENRPKRSLLHRSVPLNDAFDMKSPKSTLLASPTKAGRASSVKLPGKPPKPPLRGCENQMMVMPCARAVLLSRKKWIRRVLLGLTIADLALVSRECDSVLAGSSFAQYLTSMFCRVFFLSRCVCHVA